MDIQNNIVSFMSDMSVVSLTSFLFAFSFVAISYVIHTRNRLYFDIVPAILLVMFIFASGFLNGLSWISIGNKEAAFIWLSIGLGLEIAKPVLIRGGTGSIFVKGVILLLQIISVISATTVILGQLQIGTNEYLNHKSKVLSTFGNVNSKQLEDKYKSIILSESFIGKSNSELVRSLAYYKTLQGEPTKRDKRKGYRKRLLDKTIYILTNKCTNDISPYYKQRSACTNIIELNLEIKDRKAKAKAKELWDNSVIVQNSTRTALYDKSYTQNTWITAANRLVSFFHPDYIFEPKSDLDIQKIKQQNEISSLLIAVIIGVIIELILSILSYKTFTPVKQKVEYSLWFIFKKFLFVKVDNLNRRVKDNLVIDNVSMDTSLDDTIPNANLSLQPKTKKMSLKKIKPVQQKQEYHLTESRIKLKDVIKNINESILLEIYHMNTGKHFKEAKGRYIELSCYILQNYYVEYNALPSQKKIWENYKEQFGTSIQFPEISSSLKLIRPMFTNKEKRSYRWKSKEQLITDLRSIGLNVI